MIFNSILLSFGKSRFLWPTAKKTAKKTISPLMSIPSSIVMDSSMPMVSSQVHTPPICTQEDSDTALDNEMEIPCSKAKILCSTIYLSYASPVNQ